MFKTTFNESEKLWTGGPKARLDSTDFSFGKFLLEALKRFPNKVAQISANNGVQLTFEEIYLKTIRAAQHIETLGYKDGDIIGIMSRNTHHLAPIALALFALGYPFQPVDPSFTETEVTHLFGLTKPTIVFSDLESYDVVDKSLRNTNNEAIIYTFGERVGRSRLVEDLFVEIGRETEFVPATVDNKKIALIVCSSGTTGLPKAISIPVELIHVELPRMMGTDPNEVLLTFSTLYWVSGIFVLLLGTLQSSTRIITTASFTPELLLDIIVKFRVTSVTTSSYHMVLLLKCPALQQSDLSRVRCFMAGGSIVTAQICRDFKKFLPNGFILIGYGMSELFGGIAVTFDGTANDSCGKLVPGVTVKIVDDDGKRLGIGEDGEVRILREYRFAGYYNDQESTDAFFDDEGFIRTGDIGHFDEDGFLYIVDRKKEIIKYHSFMISPAEVENFLLKCPDIKSVCVVGIKDSESVSDDLPTAVVVRQENSKITAAEIQDLVANGLADSRKLRGGVYFVDSLPMTASGKLLRRAIKLQAEQWAKIRT